MSTTPTNLPVPSEKPQDLKFNAGKIDEFVTSMAQQYIDRFGNAHYTIEGLKQLVLQQIYNLGWNPVGTFQDGATLTSAGDIIQDTTTGAWYRWDDLSTIPETVPEGSTPESSGGIGDGKWLAVDVSDVLRKDLASSNGAAMVGLSNGDTVQEFLDKFGNHNDGYGDALLAVRQPFTGARDMTQHDYNALYINAKQFDGVTGVEGDDQTDGLQKAIYAAQGGILIIPAGTYGISSMLKIKSNTKVIAYGALIKRTNPSVTCLIINDSDGSVGGYSANGNIFIEGGIWDCNKELEVNECNGFAFGHCTNIHVNNLEIRNTGDRWHCIEVNACDSVFIEKCRFSGSYLKASEAIQIDNAGDDGRWPYFGPFDNYPCTSVHINNNFFNDFGWAIATHSSVDMSIGRHSKIFICGNVGGNLYGGAINCTNWTGYVIHGNSFQGAKHDSVVGDSAIRIVYDSSSNAPNTDFKITNNSLFGWSENGAFNIRIQGVMGSVNEFNEINKGVISGNSLYSTGSQHNLSIRYATDIKVDNNSFERPTDTTKRALLFYQGRRLSASGNTGIGDVELGNLYNESSVHITFIGNNVNGNLYVSNTTTYCTIVGNRYTAQIGTASTDAIFSANRTG